MGYVNLLDIFKTHFIMLLQILHNIKYAYILATKYLIGEVTI